MKILIISIIIVILFIPILLLISTIFTGLSIFFKMLTELNLWIISKFIKIDD